MPAASVPVASKRMQLDEALREHAKLPGAIDGFRVAGCVDHFARNLPDATVAAHRGAAQDPEGLLFRQLGRAHEDALGAIDQLALVVATIQVGERAAQLLLVSEAHLRELDERAQAPAIVAAQHQCVHARIDRTIDAVAFDRGGEHHAPAAVRSPASPHSAA